MLSKNTTRISGLAFALTMLWALSGEISALAQTSSDHVLQLQGIEIWPGVVDETRDIRFGVAFAGRSAGNLPGLFAAAINYWPSSPGPDVTNTIIGGSWAVTVIQNRRVIGTLFGQVTDGLAVWDPDGKMAAVNANVIIKGGTKRFLGVTGSGKFLGLLDHTPLENNRLPTLVGDLTLNF